MSLLFLFVLVPYSPVICGLLKVSYQSISKTLLMELLGVQDGETCVWHLHSALCCVSAYSGNLSYMSDINFL